jgi:hypothetical protein
VCVSLSIVRGDYCTVALWFSFLLLMFSFSLCAPPCFHFCRCVLVLQWHHLLVDCPQTVASTWRTAIVFVLDRHRVVGFAFLSLFRLRFLFCASRLFAPRPLLHCVSHTDVSSSLKKCALDFLTWILALFLFRSIVAGLLLIVVIVGMVCLRKRKSAAPEKDYERLAASSRSLPALSPSTVMILS